MTEEPIDFRKQELALKRMAPCQPMPGSPETITITKRRGKILSRSFGDTQLGWHFDVGFLAWSPVSQQTAAVCP